MMEALPLNPRHPINNNAVLVGMKTVYPTCVIVSQIFRPEALMYLTYVGPAHPFVKDSSMKSGPGYINVYCLGRMRRNTTRLHEQYCLQFSQLTWKDLHMYDSSLEFFSVHYISFPF